MVEGSLTIIESPQKGFDLNSEMACYSLPYGGLGFASHVLTYYTLFCLWNGVSPFWPARSVKYGKFDLIVSSIGLVISSSMAIFTLVKCRNTWQLLVIGVWKLSVSLMNGFTSLNVAVLIFRANSRVANKEPEYEPTAQKEEGEEGGIPSIVVPKKQHIIPDLEATYTWILLYAPGAFAGMAGIMSLVVPHLHDHRVFGLTVGFYGWIGLLFIVGIFIARGDDQGYWSSFFTALAIAAAAFLILAPFYGDWILGLLTGNLAGIPSKDNAAFYWTYFIAKRLAMFSW